jgi:geranylgeranyl pyrophosphate synthase
MSAPNLESHAFAEAIRFARSHAVTPEQGRLLTAAIEARGTRDRGVGAEGYRRFVRVPPAVSEAVCGDPARATPVIVALALLHTGMDTLDDLMDGDPRPWWRDYGSAEVLLAGATLVSALPQLVIAEMDAPRETIARMQRAVAEAGMVISAGQQGDILATGRDDLTGEAVQVTIARKSGETHGLAAVLAALIAGADGDRAACYQQMGRAIGSAGQIASDCHDLFVAPESRDLQRGARTLPIVLALGAVSGGERSSFLSLLERAGTDPDARSALRRRLLDDRILHTCALIVDIHCRRAYAALTKSGASGPARDTLQQIIDDCSLLDTHTGGHRHE